MRHTPFFLIARRALILAAALAPLARAANGWPSRPVRIIVPAFPGSPADVVARSLADELEKRLGQAVVIENKGGAQGALGLDLLARADPDGYTFGMVNLQSAATPALRKLPYDFPTSFAAVSQLTFESPVLLVSNKLPARDMASLIKHLQANQGKLSYASSGTGTPSHLGMELLLRVSGAKALHVPYKGAAAAGTDVAGGVADMTLVGSGVALQLLKGDRVRAIAVSSDKRLKSLPEVPTLEEAGFPSLDVRGWVGLVAPAKTPNEIVTRMQSAVEAALATPAVQARLDTVGSTPTSSKPQAFAAFMEREAQRWQKIVKEAGIKFD